MKILKCSPSDIKSEIAHFFASNVDSSYISHSELQWGYANMNELGAYWKDGLIQKVEKELENMFLRPDASLYVVKENDKIICFFIIEEIVNEAHGTKYGLIQDLLVDREIRGSGIGSSILAFIEDKMRESGICEIYLESGFQNKSAHFFFEKNGFKCTSIVMRKTIC